MDSASRLLKTYESGDVFGELALLYNATRAATIISQTDCILYSLDRSTFNHIVKDAASKKRLKYDDFLRSIKLLESMDNYERSQLADGIKEATYEPN